LRAFAGLGEERFDVGVLEGAVASDRDVVVGDAGSIALCASLAATACRLKKPIEAGRGFFTGTEAVVVFSSAAACR
jgi:hypothetical protein